jgi:hypothetical protein
MESMNVDTLPVVNKDKRFVGIVNRSRLTASLIIDVANELKKCRYLCSIKSGFASLPLRIQWARQAVLLLLGNSLGARADTRNPMGKGAVLTLSNKSRLGPSLITPQTSVKCLEEFAAYSVRIITRCAGR